MRRRNAAQETLALKQALGHTVLSNNHIKSCSSLESIFYIAGSTIVRYSHIENVQKAFYFSDKPLSSIAVSQDGHYLAAGERGHAPSVIVWDVLKQERIATLKGHKNGVGCLAFSHNGRYLVSVGFKPDKQLLIWNWQEEKILSTQKLVNKVHSIGFQEDDEYFVTAGDRHLKWWYLHEVIEGESISVEGKPASIMEEHRTSVFVDIVCGKLQFDGNVYCTTASGLLCMFNSERSVSKWVQLDTTASYCLQLFAAQGAAGLLTVGCASGTIRAFSPSGLEYIATLPVPTPMKITVGENNQPLLAACYSLTIAHPPSAFAEGGRYSDQANFMVPRLFATYADRTMILWDINDIFDCQIIRETRSHHSCIWDVKFLPNPTRPSASNGNVFATCSADNTLRFWNVDAITRRSKKRSSGTGDKVNSNSNTTCDHLLGMLELEAPHGAVTGADHSIMSHGDGPSVIASTATGLSVTNAKVPVEFNYADGIPDFELPDRPQSSYFPRTLSFHPLGTHLACGDKSGKLHVYDVQSMQEIYSVQAHSAEILSVAYAPVLVSFDEGKTWALDATTGSVEGGSPVAQRLVLLATAGRDRLIHVFAASIEDENDSNKSVFASMYTVVDTLDHHSASVTCVTFTPDGSKMISCGGDKTMVLYHIFSPSQITAYKTISTPLGSINDIQVDVSNKFVVTSGQDKRLNIWNLHSGKHMRAYKNLVHPDQVTAELFKTDIDPSGSYIVTVDFDKRITILDFFSGEVIGQVKAHGELITNVAFSRDGSHIVTVGGDGVILVWQVADILVKAMQDRLMELVMIAQRRNQKLSQAAPSDTNNNQNNNALPAPSAHANIPSQPPTTDSCLPPPPPTADMVASSLTSLKLKHHQQSITNNDTNNNHNITQSTTTTTVGGSKRVSRWRIGGGVGGISQSSDTAVSAAIQAGGEAVDAYELHGRKIIVTDQVGPRHDKFTLELTTSDALRLANEKTWHPSASEDDGVQVDVRHSVEDGHLHTITSLNVQAAEDADAVLVHHTGDDEENFVDTAEKDDEGAVLVNKDHIYEDDDVFDDEDDGEKLFRSQPSTTEPAGSMQEDLENGKEKDGDAMLSSTQSRLDSLEETLHGLEDWLETKLRNDSTNEQQPVSNKSDASDGLDLNCSISAAFFQQGKRSLVSVDATKPVVESLESMPPSQNIATSSHDLDQRRRENQLRLSSMRERLRAMGIDEQEPPKQQPSFSQEHGTIGFTQTLPPPPPPRTPAKESSTEKAESASLFNTPSTVSYDEEHGHGQDVLSNNTSKKETSGSSLLKTQLRDKQQHYLSVLRELDAAKEKALQSYQELLTLRASTSTHSFASPSVIAIAVEEEGGDDVEEADMLLAQFRQSLSSFSLHTKNNNNSDNGASVFLEHDQLLLRSSLEESVRATLAAGTTLANDSCSIVSSPTNNNNDSNSNNSLNNSNSLSENTISAILERYSDRLVDIVGDKLVTKLSRVSATPQKAISSL